MVKSLKKRQEHICELLDPVLEDLLNTLHEKAMSGNISAAKTLLAYHTPSPKADKDFLNLPDMATVSAEQRLNQIFILTARGQLDLDSAERLAKMVAIQLHEEETTRFLTFLRKVANGADPVVVARELADRMAAETKGEILQ